MPEDDDVWTRVAILAGLNGYSEQPGTLPRAMDYVLVELKPHGNDGTRPAMIKRLLAVTPTKLRLRQYNPARDFDLDRRTVLRVYRVLDWDELLGV